MSRKTIQRKKAAQQTDKVLAKEIEADEHGIIYAAMAGFNTSAIITEDQKVNFFLLYGFQDLLGGLAFPDQFCNGHTFGVFGFDKSGQLLFGLHKNFLILLFK